MIAELETKAKQLQREKAAYLAEHPEAAPAVEESQADQ